jgi:serine protease Do
MEAKPTMDENLDPHRAEPRQAPGPDAWRASSPPAAPTGVVRHQGVRSTRAVLAGAMVGALVGVLVTTGVLAASERGESGSLHPAVAVARNTSVFVNPMDVHAVLATVERAVVAITAGTAAGKPLLGQATPSVRAGTGVVISSDGSILTNDHVISGAAGQIQVTFLDGTHTSATVGGEDPAADLAVLKVDATGLTPAVLADSDRAQVGDAVIAIGNALALAGQPTVTEGIVSALNRSVSTDVNTTLDHLIQTDAAINPGNSGGPLVNSSGQVVGINTAIADPTQAQHVGFAIPINQAKQSISTLREGNGT